jgi:pimeloyl-ACP methyl ester carboxylesterase
MEHKSIDVGSTRLHVVQEGKGPPVILLHGFPEFWYSWRHQIEALASKGFTAIAPDLRGYNLSDKPKGVSLYRMDYLVDDIIGLMSVLGHPAAHIVGHDWGGVIAWVLAAQQSDRVNKLVVLNAPHPVRMAQALVHRSQLRRSWYIFAFQVPGLPEWYVRQPGFIARRLRAWGLDPGMLSDDELARYEEAIRMPGAARAALNYYRAAVRHPTLKIPMVRRPALVIWGDRDGALGPELLDGLHHHASDLRIHRIPHAGHFVQQEAPEEVSAALIDFLREPAHAQTGATV